MEQKAPDYQEKRLIRPQRKAANSENSKQTAGRRNRPLGLLLERMTMSMILIICTFGSLI